jgi:hypothetical protein
MFLPCPENARFWDTFQIASERRKMALIVCQKPFQNQSAKTYSVLGFGSMAKP